MATVHRLRRRGHVLEVNLEDGADATHAALRLDGVVVASREMCWGRCTFDLRDLEPVRVALGSDGAGARVQASTGWVGRGPSAATLLLPSLGGRHTAVPFEPPQGTRAHRRWAWQRRHPRLHAARHVAVATAQMLAGVVGLGILLSLLPRIPWPDLNLPRIPWPGLDLPRIPWPELPDVALPGWLLAVLESRKYWWPVAVALAVAVLEVRRRQRHRALEDAANEEEGEAGWPAPSTPSGTSSADSSSSTPP
jgi:hypothetical protein